MMGDESKNIDIDNSVGERYGERSEIKAMNVQYCMTFCLFYFIFSILKMIFY